MAIVALMMLAALPHKGVPAAHTDQKDYHDTLLYRTMVANVVEGRGYYSTVANEHRAHGYPTSPPQVFREPALAWFLAILRFDAIRTGCLFLFTATIIFQFHRSLLRSDLRASGRVLFIAAVSTGLGFVVAKDAVYAHEVWASLLLALSLLLYREDRWWLSVLIAVVACLIRELALPFLFVMAAFAFFERKWPELIGWVVGALIFAVALTAHLGLAAQLYKPGDLVSSGWIALGGWSFALETARFNLLVHEAPLPIAAFLVSSAVIGLAGARDGRSQRAAFVVFSYLAALIVVGRPDNRYWGLIYTPLLSIGFAYAPEALRDLVMRAFAPNRSAI